MKEFVHVHILTITLFSNQIFQDLPNELQAIEECIHEQQAQADLCGAASHDNGKDVRARYINVMCC